MPKARAIWKGQLSLNKHHIAVKLYSAVEDRSVRFHLLHAKDGAPVEQHIVRKDDGSEVEHDAIRKALALSADTAVILQPDELAKLAPAPSREIRIQRFVAADSLNDQWYDHPYYLGPDGAAESYAAFTAALERRQLTGIACWVMRNKRYVGALTTHDGCLVVTTLRRSDQVLSFSGIEPAKAAAPQSHELKLAAQLVDSIAGDFDPRQWHDEYRERLCRLIEAKARGEKPAARKRKKQPPQTGLLASLKASIAATREKQVA